MTNIEKFRPGSAIASGWVLILFFAGFIIQTAVYGGDLLITTTFCFAGGIGSYLLFLKPYVVIFNEGIKIVNPTKEILVGWDLVEEIETKYSMSIRVGGETFYAWAAPAPSRRHSRGLHATDLLPGSDTPRRLGDSPRSDSGVCAHIAKLRRKEFAGGKTIDLRVSSHYLWLYIAAACSFVGVAGITF